MKSRTSASHAVQLSAAGLAVALLVALPAAATQPQHPRDPLLESFGARSSGPRTGDPSDVEHASAPIRTAAGIAQALGWQPGFGLPVPDGRIVALLPHGDRLIAAGDFRRIGDLDTHGIATWDGARWSRLGAFPGGNVLDLAPQGDDVLALCADQVWRWNGQEWSSLGMFPIPLNNAEAMAVDGDRVAVSASRSESSGWHSYVMLYAQGEWRVLGGAFSSPPPWNQGIAWSLAWYGGELFAGGDFQTVGDTPCLHVARWDGAAWQPVGDGLGGSPGELVRGMTAFGGELVATGIFDHSITSSGYTLARWDGHSWSPFAVPASFPGVVRLRVVDSQLYAVGHTSSWPASGPAIARWDGIAWHLDEGEFRDWVYDVADYQSRFYAGGSLSIMGSQPATPLMRRDGGVWESLTVPGAGMHGFLGVSGPFVRALIATDEGILAAGNFDFAGTAGGWRPCSSVARWDGSEWRSLGLESMAESIVSGIALHEGTLYAIGYFSPVASQYYSVVRQIGGAWEPVGNQSNGPVNASCITSALGSVFVGAGGANDGPAVLRWDGKDWNVVGRVTAGQASSWIGAIAASGSDLIVAGEFTEINGVAANHIAAWNPTTGWRGLGTGVDYIVTGLLSRGGALYVSGLFTTAGGIPVDGIAVWNGGAWSALPSPRSQQDRLPYVYALGSYRGYLVAAGPSVDGYMASLGSDHQWHPFPGMEREPFAMVENGPSLFIGGAFSQVGGMPSYGFAEWREPEALVPSVSTLAAAPNPFTTDVHIRYELSAGATVRVEMFDLSGRMLERAFDGWQSAGAQDVVWHASARGVKPGIYFARVLIGDRSEVARVMRVK